MAPHTIAVAGKGGVGKTTTCGMIIDYLCAKKRGPVLVVDADANSNLNEVWAWRWRPLSARSGRKWHRQS